jgi:hypothetical protein
MGLVSSASGSVVNASGEQSSESLDNCKRKWYYTIMDAYKVLLVAKNGDIVGEYFVSVGEGSWDDEDVSDISKTFGRSDFNEDLISDIRRLNEQKVRLQRDLS